MSIGKYRSGAIQFARAIKHRRKRAAHKLALANFSPKNVTEEDIAKQIRTVLPATPAWYVRFINWVKQLLGL